MAKKVPVRTCLACGEKFPKRNLMRIVRTPEGNFHLDPSGKMQGRGAYLCKQSTCLANSVLRKRLQASFKTSVDDDQFAHLLEEVSAYVDKQCQRPKAIDAFRFCPKSKKSHFR